MKTGPVAASPDAYVAGLDGWRREQAKALPAALQLNADLGHPVKAARKSP